jgi:hypothetical protein
MRFRFRNCSPNDRNKASVSDFLFPVGGTFLDCAPIRWQLG